MRAAKGIFKDVEFKESLCGLESVQSRISNASIYVGSAAVQPQLFLIQRPDIDLDVKESITIFFLYSKRDGSFA
ncbi:hypothetical protein E6O75_ATG05318 [Venturia nashicola]|uniref:Uncharacterized protein n=1 Tax=Venturia nashicola TaxID=86259 RepID=A0A4Z1PG21_9PEZI|nr:hypothetical protein E6O75_ATG05318 [Venturia nashicola]